jgi:glycosyltransferase involved in cell wall biosynthesis
MKKCLLIAYFFPPYRNIGALRPYKLSKYLPGCGWEPVVLTSKAPGIPPGGIRVISADYKDVVASFKKAVGLDSGKSLHEKLNINVTKKYDYPTLKGKIIKGARDIITFPDEKKGWYGFAYKSACDFLDHNRVDAIISTSPPVITHLLAKKLKIKYKIPWIADFRDPWTQKSVDHRMGIIKYLDRKLEKKTISSADLLISVSAPYVDKIHSLHKKKKIFCITNGFDPEDFCSPAPKLTEKFTITYTGVLYNGRRDPSLLFKALHQLISEGSIEKDLLEVRFYSKKEAWLTDEVVKNKLNGVVDIRGLVPRDEVIEKQRESQLLLVLRWDNKEEGGNIPAKMYEYFAAGRPIIYVGGCGGIIKDMLDHTNSGRFAENNVASIKAALMHYYREFLEQGSVSYQGNSNIEEYNYNLIAKKYSEALNSLV